MSRIRKVLVGPTLVFFVGAWIFQANQLSGLRRDLQIMEKQKASMVEQMSALKLERDQANNRVVSLVNELSRVKTNSAEILRLRGEVARLLNEGRDLKPQTEKSPVVSPQPAEKSEVDRLNQIAQWLQRHPSEKTPELKLLSAQDWLKAAEGHLDNEADYPFAMSKLRMTAEATRVLPVLQAALTQYASANPGQFPQNLSDLTPYFNPPLEEEMLQRYEIMPLSGLRSAVGPSDDINFGSDLVITEKSPANEAFDARMVVGMSNFVFSLGTNRWVSAQ